MNSGPREWLVPDTAPAPAAAAPRELPEGTVLLPSPAATAEGEAASLAEIPPAPRRRFPGRWAWRLAGGALLSLIVTALSLWAADLAADAASWSPGLGIAVAALGVLLVGALAVGLLSELLAVARLRSLQRRRHAAELAEIGHDIAAARRLVDGLAGFLGTAAERRAALAQDLQQATEAEQVLRLGERHLLRAADEEAEAAVARAVRDTALATAILPLAVLDAAFVGWRSLRMLRRIAEAYGLRPGLLGCLKLLGGTFGNLALAGALEVGQQAVLHTVGAGVARKFAGRMGEGLANAALTARLGRAAILMLRPLPWHERQPPSLQRLLAGIPQ